MTRAPGAFLGAAAALLLAGCRAEPSGTVIARAGDAVLTLEDARAVLDTTAPNIDDLVARYAASWVNAELLWQEARRAGIDDDPRFVSRMDDVRRQLAGQELLDRVIHTGGADLPEDSLRSYLAAHPDEFSIAEDHLKLKVAVFRSREAARRFAASVTAARPWDAALDSLVVDPRASADILSAAPGRWYTAATLYPPDLWKVAGPLSPGEVSFPVRGGDGYAVIQYLAAARAGKTTEFDLVRGEVLARMLVESRRARLDSLLGTLRERHGVELNVSPAARQKGASAPRD